MRKASIILLAVFQIIGFTSLFLSMQVANPSSVSAATGPCTAPSTDYGNVTSTVNIPSTGTYYIWSRIQAPSSSANSYLIQIDNAYCFNVGGNSSIPTNSWQWINYQNGSTGSRISVSNLSSGNHSVKMIGNKDGVLLDRVIFTQDASCTPDNITPVQNGAQPGDNCANPSDTTPPSANITGPAAGSTQSGSVNITGTASDAESGIDKVDFLVNGNSVHTDNTDDKSSYSYSWNTATGSFPDGTYILSIKAYNKDGLSKVSSTRTITVKNTVVERKPGDINNDNKVDSDDLAIFAFYYGRPGNWTYDQGDFSGDGKVDSLDIGTLSFGWGK